MTFVFTTIWSDEGSGLRMTAPLGDIIVPFDDTLVADYIVRYKQYLHAQLAQIKTRVEFKGPRGARGGDWEDPYRFVRTMNVFIAEFADYLDLLAFTTHTVPERRNLKPATGYTWRIPIVRRFIREFAQPQTHILDTYHNPNIPSAVKLEQIAGYFASIVRGIETYHTATSRWIYTSRNDPLDRYHRIFQSTRAPDDFAQDLLHEHIGDSLLLAMKDMTLRRRLEQVALLATLEEADVLLAALTLWEQKGWDGLEIAESYMEYL